MRTTIKLLLTLTALLLSLLARAEPILLASDLAEDARVSREQTRPIVFFVTADHCPYCERLRDEYFKFSPGDQRFILRELELDQHHGVIDFQGKQSDHRQVADHYDISLTPTVAFVGPDGQSLTESIVGVLTMDYYHYYFEQALGKSISALRGAQLAKTK